MVFCKHVTDLIPFATASLVSRNSPKGEPHLWGVEAARGNVLDLRVSPSAAPGMVDGRALLGTPT